MATIASKDRQADPEQLPLLHAEDIKSSDDTAATTLVGQPRRWFGMNRGQWAFILFMVACMLVNMARDIDRIRGGAAWRDSDMLKNPEKAAERILAAAPVIVSV